MFVWKRNLAVFKNVYTSPTLYHILKRKTKVPFELQFMKTNTPTKFIFVDTGAADPMYFNVMQSI